ncbi:MAG: hypothetical protein MJK04_36440, partial [Psychrosphaera sp.]|nr:hypothetical protein [Psychrosphaera sp.]
MASFTDNGIDRLLAVRIVRHFEGKIITQSTHLVKRMFHFAVVTSRSGIALHFSSTPAITHKDHQQISHQPPNTRMNT